MNSRLESWYLGLQDHLAYLTIAVVNEDLDAVDDQIKRAIEHLQGWKREA